MSRAERRQTKRDLVEVEISKTRNAGCEDAYALIYFNLSLADPAEELDKTARADPAIFAKAVAKTEAQLREMLIPLYMKDIFHRPLEDLADTDKTFSETEVKTLDITLQEAETANIEFRFACASMKKQASGAAMLKTLLEAMESKTSTETGSEEEEENEDGDMDKKANFKPLALRPKRSRSLEEADVACPVIGDETTAPPPAADNYPQITNWGFDSMPVVPGKAKKIGRTKSKPAKSLAIEANTLADITSLTFASKLPSEVVGFNFDAAMKLPANSVPGAENELSTIAFGLGIAKIGPVKMAGDTATKESATSTPDQAEASEDTGPTSDPTALSAVISPTSPVLSDDDADQYRSEIDSVDYGIDLANSEIITADAEANVAIENDNAAAELEVHVSEQSGDNTSSTSNTTAMPNSAPSTEGARSVVSEAVEETESGQAEAFQHAATMEDVLTAPAEETVAKSEDSMVVEEATTQDKATTWKPLAPAAPPQKSDSKTGARSVSSHTDAPSVAMSKLRYEPVPAPLHCTNAVVSRSPSPVQRWLSNISPSGSRNSEVTPSPPASSRAPPRDESSAKDTGDAVSGAGVSRRRMNIQIGITTLHEYLQALLDPAAALLSKSDLASAFLAVSAAEHEALELDGPVCDDDADAVLAKKVLQHKVFLGHVKLAEF